MCLQRDVVDDALHATKVADRAGGCFLLVLPSHQARQRHPAVGDGDVHGVWRNDGTPGDEVDGSLGNLCVRPLIGGRYPHGDVVGDGSDTVHP
jgi:hypothetical protein